MSVNKTSRSQISTLILGLCIGCVGFGTQGCQNTAEGAKEDTQKNGAAVQNATERATDTTKNAAENAATNTRMAADNAASATRNGAANAEDALTLTPKVKDAIVANAALRNSKNTINVNTKDGVVHLNGHVASAEERKLAGEIAEKAVRDSGSPDKVMNELTVNGKM